IIAYSYLGSQGTSLGIARNIKDHTAARYVAESGMDLALAYVKATSDWRTARSVGEWVSNAPLAGGFCTIRADDGEDLDGDGIIGPGEGDGDLNNDPSDPLTLTVTGRVNQSTCVVKVVLRSSGGGTGEDGGGDEETEF